MQEHIPHEPSAPGWKHVWERKGRHASARLQQAPASELGLAELLGFNGYDTAAAAMTQSTWLDYVEHIASRLRLSQGSRVCEVGCGAGALLWPLQRRGIELWGADYVEDLIQICRHVMPDGHFAVAEATHLPFESASFDAVFSNGVCIYFPDWEYARSAFAEKVRLLKPGGRIALLDVNDAARKDEYVAVKVAALGEAEYRRLYRDQQHLFFSREQLAELADEHALELLVEDQQLPGYPNAKFRFNAIFRDRREP